MDADRANGEAQPAEVFSEGGAARKATKAPRPRKKIKDTPGSGGDGGESKRRCVSTACIGTTPTSILSP